MFGGTAAIGDVRIVGSGGAGGNEYISSPLKTTLNNPSNISLAAGVITLPTFYQGVQLGESIVPAFNLAPGSNTLDAEFRYHPANANDSVAQSFLQQVRRLSPASQLAIEICSQFLEKDSPIPVTINGDGNSAQFESLTPALEQTALSSGVPGIAAKIVTKINVYLSLSGAVTSGEVE